MTESQTPLAVTIEPVAQTGAANMAADRAMLDAVIAGGCPTLRWYRWNEPTISLGRFQDDDPVVEPSLPRVRRESGGGAIRHDREWTYAIALPRGACPGNEPVRLYRVFHEAIIEALTRYGATVRLRGVAEEERDGAFLCFLRGDANDLLLPDGRKVVGSAQRRARGCILQHGSLLWNDAEGGGLNDIYPALPPITDAAAILQTISGLVADSLSLRTVFSSPLH